MKRLIRALAVAVAIVLSPGMAFASASPTANSDAAAAKSWFNHSAEGEIQKHGDGKFEKKREIRVASPTHASIFSGNKDDLRASDSEYWVAPVKSGDQIVGTVAIKVTDGLVSEPIITTERNFGKELAKRTPKTTVVLDPNTHGWFLLDDSGHVRPLDSRARKVVAGTLTLREFASVRQSLRSSASSSPSTARASQGDSSVFVIVVFGLVGVFGMLIAAAWVRHSVVKKRGKPGQDVTQAAAERGRSGTRVAKSTEKSGDGSRTIRFDTGEIVKVYEMPVRRDEGEDR